MRELAEKKAIKGYKNLGQYFKYVWHYKGLCLGFFTCLAIIGVCSFLSPYALSKMLTYMTVEQDYSMAIRWALYFAGVEVINMIAEIARVPFFKKLENNVKKDVKLQVIKDSFNINVGQFEKLGNGQFITRLTSDLDSLSNSFNSVTTTIMEFLSRIGFIVYVYMMSFWIGLFITGCVIIRYFVYQIRVHYYAKMKPGVFSAAEDVNSVIGESVRGIKDIKTLGLGANITEHIGDLQDEYIRRDNKEWYVGITLYNISRFVWILTNLFFVIISVYLIQHGQLEIVVFYSLHLYKNRVMEFAVQLGNLQNQFKEMEVNAFRVFQLANGQAYKHDEFGNVELPIYHGNIEFKNVSFSYNEDEKILDDVSFSVHSNQHIAFVGESGCGKSTIVALICKLYDPTEGVILFDDVNSRALAQSFGKNIAMVNQNPYLFNLTIRENMRLVNKDVTDDEIWEVLKLANAYSFVKELPEGLNSFLGEGGTRLSGGQKQRLCIARALLKNSKVLIFDEATSALDNISQEVVMNEIEKMKKDRTIITIAHRLSTIENCDVIYFVDKGKIVDSGTHEYLLGHNKKYSTLYNKQKKEKQVQEESEE